ncbi:NTP transferase domain-containing protein [Salinisphaera japonica]|uniref:ADP-glucose pyrophosphorylase n=1 Tax=Salinisphaera japonica YTM-1 TaxID=1209778 RepID=A0A423PWX0_9GAMM|nr:NTP transferase domain-containing protein [Salinisphaera japonica]ROO30051.1 ADP-glucose pyrophosphorylase [Salinisphaera japonica YTM-1]
MHAVLLAAGVGRRLEEITGGGPKCLLPFGEMSLLERHIRLLNTAGVHRLTVVVGNEAMQIEQALSSMVHEIAPEMTVDTRHNPAFREGSTASVLAARDVLEADDDVLLMDADVLYDARLMAVFTGEGAADRVAIDTRVGADDAEAVKVALADARIVAFDKTLAADLTYDRVGESVGFFRLSPASADGLLLACETAHAADSHAPHEQALQTLMTAGDGVFQAIDIAGTPWIEVDYPADVDRAMDDILPTLEAIS